MRLAVVIPIGPNEIWQDTVDSVFKFADPEVVVAINNTREPLEIAGAEVIDSRANGNRGGLWENLTDAYVHLCERGVRDGLGVPEVVLRIDTDALLLRHGLEGAAQEAFKKDPRVGLLGSYRIGPDGGSRDFTPAATTLRREANLFSKRGRIVRSWINEASSRGYELGEHALGGAYLVRGDALHTCWRRGLLTTRAFAQSGISEDHLMALAVRVCGYTIDDFGGPGQPLALRWLGLPTSPEDLIKSQAVLVHSVRTWEGREEEEIRQVFAATRERELHIAGATRSTIQRP